MADGPKSLNYHTKGEPSFPSIS